MPSPFDRRSTSRWIIATLVAPFALAAGSCSDSGSSAASESSTATSTTTSPSAVSTTTTTDVAAGPAAVEVSTSDELYEAPSPIPDLAHGHLIRFQRVDKGYAGGGPTYRVMYSSRSAGDQPIVVTGTVHVPAGAAPAGGWPTVTWGHGTTGTADQCAVSKSLNYASAAEPMVDQGYVIASTDYEGLGTPGLHPYLVGPSEGRGMLDIVRAAGQLPGVALDGRFAAWGHSQGGHAAAFAHELAATWTPELHLVATVAIAPPAQMRVIIPAVAAMKNKTFAVMDIAGTAAAYPDVDLNKLMTPDAIAKLDVLETGCSSAVGAAFAAGDPLLQPGAAASPELLRRLDESEPGTVKADSPVLIVAGDQDTTVPPVLNAALKKSWCGIGQNTTRWLVPGATHVTVLGTAPRMIAWTVARFAGTPVTTGCDQPDGAPPAAPTP